MTATPEGVIDASAVLAYVQNETGGDRAAAAISRGVLSIVNLAEVLTKLIEHGYSDEQAQATMQRLGLDIADFTIEDAFEVARFRRTTRHQGLSLGDRACLALAKRLGVPAITADRRWRGVIGDVRIEWIR
jgi:PIN domain nuclease of toxin-antitoxin system